MNLQHLITDQTAPLSPGISREAVYAGAQRLAQTLHAPVQLYCRDSLCSAVAVLAAAIAGAEIHIQPREDKPTLSDADILSFLNPLEKAPLPALQDIDLLLSTSGSTGKCKLVRKKLSAMLTEAEVLSRLTAAYPAPAQILAGVSPQHLYGLSFSVFLPLVSGRQYSRQQYRYPELLLDAAAHCTLPHIWLTTPVLLQTLVTAYPPPQWRSLPALVICAGGVLAQETAALLRRHVPVADIYGSTETGAIAADVGQGRQALAGVCTRSDADGILHVCSPWSDGWQCTGDVVGEQLTLLGRADRMIKRGDKRISAEALEQTLNAQPEIADSYCALHPESKRLCAWVALNPAGIEAWRNQGRKALIHSWRQALAAEHDRVAVVRHFRVCRALPRDSQGKITRQDFLTALLEPITAPVWQAPERCGDTLIIRGRIPLDLCYLKGHFDRFPLVPGVVQCRWVLQLAQQHLGLHGFIGKIEQLKFRQFLRPDDLLSITLSYHAERGKLKFSCCNGQEECASGRIVYTSPGQMPASP